VTPLQWQTAVPPPTTITFDPVVFAAARTIVLNGTQLELSNTSEPTTIIGPAAGVTDQRGQRQPGILIDESVNSDDLRRNHRQRKRICPWRPRLGCWN